MKIPIRSLSVGASLVALATLTACVAPAPVYQTSRYPYQPVQPMAQGPYVEYGRVANIEVLRSETAGTGSSGVGAIAGGLLGGVAGNQIGKGNGRTAATVAGVVGGALLGNSIESNRNGPRAYESYRVSVQTDNGGYRAFDVPSPGDLRIGDRVRIDNGQISRF
ncbi:glycine zipper 2TM domain-containing protein [Variovorax sp. J2P1-59]|uniref:glycine zipper 2TM domain-containing protein n=1 Tax=Variovorax flavidus TaxID=3053501 RepID=UPI0025788FBC|nr:glycine zipper 2TM domain-containing protein [Variovorax sp. J2P1-59]MDM0076342.1 glycine zipper 2TM domain-containing protein [Variovorax sp. J2P1-59]